jgi:hypothetical protein
VTKLNILIDVTVKFSQLFKWTYKDFNLQIFNDDYPILLLIRNYIPQDLVTIFEGHFSNRSEYKKLLLTFIYNLHLDIYKTIWKVRSEKWAELKHSLCINKLSFKSAKHKH